MEFSEWYLASIPHTLDMEGGFVDHADDPGGATKHGISLRWLRSTGDLDGDGWIDGDLDHDGDVDIDDIKLITKTNAQELYYQYFWLKVYEQLPTQAVAGKVFDMNVNMGKRQAHMLLQRACNMFGRDELLVDDGAIGPQTLSVVGEIGEAVLPPLRATQAGFYRGLVMRNTALRRAGARQPNGKEYPDFSKFLRGWLKRARM